MISGGWALSLASPLLSARMMLSSSEEILRSSAETSPSASRPVEERSRSMRVSRPRLWQYQKTKRRTG
jgi:hypothetical protein